MADVIRNATPQDFWQPPIPTAPSVRMAEACRQCSTEFMVGARFCHICGVPRGSTSVAMQTSWQRCVEIVRVLEFHSIKSGLGLSTGSLLAFLAGVACIVCALMVGLIYSAQTLADFQAIQLWRIEWLVAGIAAFVAGILLKRPDSSIR